MTMNPVLMQVLHLLDEREWVMRSDHWELNVAEMSWLPNGILEGPPNEHLLVTLPNHRVISVITGVFTYSDAGTVEIAFKLPNGDDFDERFVGHDEWGDDTVLGYQTPEDVVKWVERYLTKDATGGEA